MGGVPGAGDAADGRAGRTAATAPEGPEAAPADAAPADAVSAHARASGDTRVAGAGGSAAGSGRPSGRRDRHGLEASGLGSGEAGEAAATWYESAVDSLLFFRGDVAESVAELRRLAPDAPLGQAFAAYLGLLGTEESQAAAARQEFARFRAAADDGACTAREQAHLTAAAAWLDGDIARAGAVLREIAVAWPRDALALAVGHQIDFFTGNAAALRDRIAGALTAWDEEDPHYGPLLGMLGFGLEESGHYARAEETARAAVERQPGDVWGIHAVVHTLEMQGRFAEGFRFLDARRREWGADNMMAVHNWWHYALYALEAGDTRRVLEIYDAALDPAVTSGLALELLDASSLLWRFHLGGDDDRSAVGDRWAPLADAWAARRDGPHYAFNDTHAVMAYLGAGRVREAEALLADREEWATHPHPGVTNHTMTAEIGLPVCRALVAFTQERYEDAVDLLFPLRGRFATFGGSHAQRDAVQRTLLEAALRAGRLDLARTLLSERLALRPTSPYNWLGQARLADAVGRAALAATARARAAALAAPGRSSAQDDGPAAAADAHGGRVRQRRRTHHLLHRRGAGVHRAARRG
ncbi:tetratricopeptide repeat protein, partial [Streptomyces sp. NPDC006992]|uniref:tetratricopeptide repeat protein n=1 Tax=Streptomyces sp. NPDC006992 TaxID=3155601 RepID=UPI0033C74E06